MASHPDPILQFYAAQQVRQLDAKAIHEHNLAGSELMQRAGEALFQQLLLRWPEARCILILCGSGNNGGDGYVLARLAMQIGLEVLVCQPTGVATKAGTDAATAAQAFEQVGGQYCRFEPNLFRRAEVIVDALLGTGLNSELGPQMVELVHLINQAECPVLSADVPTGLHADTGAIMGAAVRADVTVTFIAAKLGLVTGAGPDHSGELVFADLGVPSQIYCQVPPLATGINVDLIRRSLGPRRATSHKGDFGHLLVVGGAPGMGGAVRLAAEAALRVGTGRVSLAVHPSQATSLNVGRPELMVHKVSSAEELNTLLAKATVVALGPGLGLSDWSKSMWKACLEQGLPIVVDADGLNLLAEHGPVAESNLILTPHPGEAARLLACSIHAIEQDRVAAIQALQSKYQAPVVLKGAGSLVMDSELQLWVCLQGNPGMASAGMGDLLTGVIAGLLAQGVAANMASRLGVLLHALAGDRAAGAGERGLVASDLLPHLRKLVNLG